ncbi:MAG: peptidoglycan-binding protein, partial [Clostridia bacterium]
NEAANGFVKEGLPQLADDPTEIEMPEAAMYSQANANRLLPKAAPYAGWTWARLHTIAEIKATILQAIKTPGINIMFCARMSARYPDNMGWLGTDGELLGYHEMVIRGYEPRKWAPWSDENIDGVLVRNSWGEAWGMNGECYMRWEDVLKMDDIIAFFPPIQTTPVQPDKNIVVVRRTLRSGMRGEDVTELQTMLIKNGYASIVGEADGAFGKKTQSAVMEFQSKYGLTADGIVGPKTWAALESGNDTPDDTKPTERQTRFLSYLTAQLGQIYVWGGNGQEMTPTLIKRMETTTKNAQRALALYEKRKAEGKAPILGYDCSGLISRFLQNEGLTQSKRNSRMLYEMCEKTERDALQPFDIVFRHDGDKIFHVGVYIGAGMAIEAKGRDDGVVKRTLDASGKNYWNRFGRLALISER